MTSQGWNTTLLNHWHRRQGKNHYDSNIWDVIYSAYHFQVVLVKSWEIFFSSATFTISPTVTKDLELTKNFEILLIGQPTTFRIGHKKQDKRQVWPHYKPLKNRFHCVCVFIVKMSVLVQCFFSFPIIISMTSRKSACCKKLWNYCSSTQCPSHIFQHLVIKFWW